MLKGFLDLSTYMTVKHAVIDTRQCDRLPLYWEDTPQLLDRSILYPSTETRVNFVYHIAAIWLY